MNEVEVSEMEVRLECLRIAQGDIEWADKMARFVLGYTEAQTLDSGGTGRPPGP